MVSTKNKIRLAIIGAGRQGRRHALAIVQSGDTELVVIADVNPDSASALAEEMECESTDDWLKAVQREDIDAVLICTPPNLHAAISIAAAKRGKHVLCEKPLARDSREAGEMVDAARDNGVILKCGFNLRHHPAIQRAKELVDQGMIGELSFIRCRYGIGGRPGYDKEWRADKEVAGGGQLTDQGMHALDLSRWFLGDFCEAVGFLNTSFWDIAPMEDNVFILLRTEKGQTAQIHASWTQWKNLFSLEVYGKDGYILVEGLGGSYGVETLIFGKRAFLEPFKEEVTEFRGDDRSWYAQWHEFVTAVRENQEPMTSGADALETMKLADAIYKSAGDSQVIRI